MQECCSSCFRRNEGGLWDALSMSGMKGQVPPYLAKALLTALNQPQPTVSCSSCQADPHLKG